MKAVKVGNGYYTFPDSMSEEEIKAVLSEKFPTPEISFEETEADKQEKEIEAMEKNIPSARDVYRSTGYYDPSMRDARPLTSVEQEDIARVGIGAVKNVASLAQDLLGTIRKKYAPLADDPSGEDKIGKAARASLSGLGLEEEQIDQILTDENKVQPTVTGLGTALEIGTFFAGYGGARKGVEKVAEKMPGYLKEIGAASVATQALSDPSENIGNVVEDFLNSPEEENRGMVLSVAKFLSADPGDSVLEQRIKLLGEEPLFFALGLGAFKGGKALTDAASWANQQSIKLFGKNASQLTPEERSTVTSSYLDEAKKRLDLKADKPVEVRIKDVEEPQEKPFASRILNRFFTSAGNFTRDAYNAFEGAKTAQRQTIARAEFVAKNLQASLDNIVDASESSQAAKSVQLLLNSKLDSTELTEDNIQRVARQFKINEEVVTHSLVARNMIDEMSTKLLDSKLSDDLKEIIGTNIGSYLRRSYRKFEDPTWKPSVEVEKKAFEYFQGVYSQQFKTKKTIDKYAQKAVDTIKQKVEWSGVEGYFKEVQSINKNIFKGRKLDEELPKEVRALMGEIEEPAENIVLTLSKMSRFYENSKFYETFENLGKRGGYLFKEESDGLVKISGTNSSLDGKYTTPEMNDALLQQEEHFNNDVFNSTAYRTFLSAKGFSQKAKTVYSHVTHLRNILGGFQFGIANGLMPYGTKGLDTAKTIWSGVKQQGDAAVVEKYNEYLGLGIINTSVKVNEFRRLLDTGYLDNSTSLLDRFQEKMGSYGKVAELGAKGITKPAKFAENFYVAVDDFYKINAYEKEKALLRKAFPDADDTTISEEAAEIVKNTFPNYDRVPPGIKALRELPLGNFISFPSEIIRTSANIVRQASKEITSGNDELRKRGLARLAGFTTATAGWGGAAGAAADALGWTPEQKEGAEILAETPWSKSSTKIFSMIDGEYYYIDTQFLDSYSTIKEPIFSFIQEVKDGTLRGEDLDTKLINASVEASKTLLRPYVSQAMLTDALADIGFAMLGEGRTPEGKALFTDEMNNLDKAWNTIAYAARAAVLPGSVASAEKLYEAFTQEPAASGISPRTKNLSLELLKNTTGVGHTKLDPANALYFAAKNFTYENRSIPSLSPQFNKTPSQLVEEHMNIERKRFEAFQELYRKYQGGVKLAGMENAPNILEIFKKAGISQTDLDYLSQGYFRPRRLSEDLLENIVDKSYMSSNFSSAVNQLISNSYYMDMTRLDTPLEEQVQGYAKGGEVLDVPNVPTEPDQRIDKMTGQPYDQQAGTAFVDEEDPLRRLGFVGGGLSRLIKMGIKAIDKGDDKVFKEAVKEGVESVDDTIRPYESVPRPATYEEMNMALDARKKEKINVDIPEGQKVGLRLDIPAYTRHDVWVPTIHDEGGTKLTSHRATAAIKDVDLLMKEADQIKGEKIKNREKPKSPFARIGGRLINRSDEENYALAQKYINDPEWTQVGYNPDKHSYFFDRATGDPIIGGEEAIQVGPLVLVKNAVKGDRKDFRYAEGGKVLASLKRRVNGV